MIFIIYLLSYNFSRDRNLKIKKFLDFRFYGLIGSIFMSLSIFLPWMTKLTLFEVYVITTTFQLEYSFMYLFPLISGVICMFGTVLLIYDKEYRVNSVIINFIGLGFLLLFLFDYIPSEFSYISSIGIGFYLCIVGTLLILLYIINILLIKDEPQVSIEKKEPENKNIKER